jgi:hypothetical protein
MDVLTMQDRVRWEEMELATPDPQWNGHRNESMIDDVINDRREEMTVTQAIAETLARKVLPLTLARYARDVDTPQQLDAIAELARLEGVYDQVVPAIVAADRRIVARIKAGVVMAKGRASMDVWNPAYYRRMYDRGFREVRDEE